MVLNVEASPPCTKSPYLVHEPCKNRGSCTYKAESVLGSKLSNLYV